MASAEMTACIKEPFNIKLGGEGRKVRGTDPTLVGNGLKSSNSENGQLSLRGTKVLRGDLGVLGREFSEMGEGGLCV